MNTQRGFSLIEMAFVLVIITLLLGGLLVPFATQVEQRRITETQKAMEEIKEALIGYAIVNGRLPCPAKSATDGSEQDQPCTSPTIGYLPWATLGVAKVDAWGRLYRYAVTPAFSLKTPLFTLQTPSTLTIKTRNAAGALVNLTNSGGIPAVIISHGKNGLGASNDVGTVLTAPSSTDEVTNATGNNDFVSRTLTTPGAGLAEFDDLVVWISPNILFNRMVAAGKLP